MFIHVEQSSLVKIEIVALLRCPVLPMHCDMVELTSMVSDSMRQSYIKLLFTKLW